MPRVLITCPDTDRKVFTGIDMDEGSWESARLENNSVRCDACGQVHTWSKDDAELEESSTKE